MGFAAMRFTLMRVLARASLIVCACVCGAWTSALAKPADADAYRAGVAALAAADFATARASFRASLEDAPSAAAYQGFAEASLAAGDVPAATWALRNAELLGGTSTLAQLKSRAYAEIPSDLVPLPLGGIDGLAAKVGRLPFPNLPALLAVLCFALVGVSLVRQIARRRDQAFAAPWVALVTGLVVGLVCLWVAFRQNTLAHPPEAVALTDGTQAVDSLQLRSAPSASAPPARLISAGTVVTTSETLAGYTQAVLPTGESGWLPTNRLWPIRPLEPTWPQ